MKHARITIHHNGVLIHDDVELPAGTGSGTRRRQLAKGPFIFQDYGNPRVYRNVWAAERD